MSHGASCAHSSSSSSFVALSLLLSSSDCLQEIINYLSNRDVASFDSALCRRRPPLRKIFTSSLQNILLNGKDEFFRRGELEWLIHRQIKIRKLKIYASLERDTLLGGDFEYKLRWRDSLRSIDVISVDDVSAHELVSDPSKLLSNIEELKISNSQFLTNVGMRKFLKCCTSLRSLQIFDSRGIDDQAFCSTSTLSSLSSNTLDSNITLASTLQHISINGCNNVTDCGVRYLVENCKCLLSLDLQNCEKITDSSIKSAGLCSNMMSLNLRSCCQITDYAMIQIAANMKNLTSLNISFTNITDIGMAELIRGLSMTLVVLDLGSCKNITNETFRALKMCLNLKFLCLSNSHVRDDVFIDITRNCAKLEVFNGYNSLLTNVSLVAIYQNLTYLERLNLSRCVVDHNLEAAGGYQGVEKLVRESVPIRLTALDLSKCRAVCDKDLMILSLITSLENIDLSGCREVTNEGIEILSSGLTSSLRVLKIAYCRKCTDDALRSIQTYCLNLNELDISDCFKITDSGLMRIAMHLSHLKTITIYDCSNILSNVEDMQNEIRKSFNSNLTIYM